MISLVEQKEFEFTRCCAREAGLSEAFQLAAQDGARRLFDRLAAGLKQIANYQRGRGLPRQRPQSAEV